MRCGSGAEDAGTVNSPQTGAPPAHRVLPHTHPVEGRHARPLVAPTTARRTLRSTPQREPPSRMPRTTWWPRRHRRRAVESFWRYLRLDLEKVLGEVVCVWTAEARHDIVAGAREVNRVAAQPNITEARQVGTCRHSVQKGVQVAQAAGRRWPSGTDSSAPSARPRSVLPGRYPRRHTRSGRR